MNEQVLEKINTFLENFSSLRFLDPNIFDSINTNKEIIDIDYGDYYLDYISVLPKMNLENSVKIAREVFQMYERENEFDNILERLINNYQIGIGTFDKNDNDCIIYAAESRILLSGTCYDVVLLCHEIGHKLRSDDELNFDKLTESLFFETPSVMLELAANDYLRDNYDIDVGADKLRNTHIASIKREDTIENYIFDLIMNVKKSGELNNVDIYNALTQDERVANYLNSPNSSIENCVDMGISSYDYIIGYILGNYANTYDNKKEVLNLLLQLKDKGLNTPFTIDENIIEESLGKHIFMNR